MATSALSNKGVSCGGSQTHIQWRREKPSRVKTASLDGANLAELRRRPVEKDICYELLNMSKASCLKGFVRVRC